jgi:hypothetical protein
MSTTIPTNGEYRLIDALRCFYAEIEEHLFWVEQHTVTLERNAERDAYLAYVRSLLARRLRSYTSCLRRIHECEQSLGYSF